MRTKMMLNLLRIPVTVKYLHKLEKSVPLFLKESKLFKSKLLFLL